MADPIKIAIADDHRLLRHGMISLLQGIEDIQVIGEMSSGEEAVNFARQHDPDIFLLDIIMDGMTGIEAARWIKEQSPKVRIILISSEVSKGFISDGIKSGVDGYLNKDISREILNTAIHAVYRGEQFFVPEIMALAYPDLYARDSAKSIVLTRQEQEILTLMANGRSEQEIAADLFLSVKTVETVRLHLQNKLNVTSVAQLINYAIGNELPHRKETK